MAHIPFSDPSEENKQGWDKKNGVWTVVACGFPLILFHLRRANKSGREQKKRWVANSSKCALPVHPRPTKLKEGGNGWSAAICGICPFLIHLRKTNKAGRTKKRKGLWLTPIHCFFHFLFLPTRADRAGRKTKR